VQGRARHELEFFLGDPQHLQARYVKSDDEWSTNRMRPPGWLVGACRWSLVRCVGDYDAGLGVSII
jgi:hypothetical protein